MTKLRKCKYLAAFSKTLRGDLDCCKLYANVLDRTAKIKQMADIRPLAIDDTDSIIHSYHLSLAA